MVCCAGHSKKKIHDIFFKMFFQQIFLKFCSSVLHPKNRPVARPGRTLFWPPPQPLAWRLSPWPSGFVRPGLCDGVRRDQATGRPSAFLVTRSPGHSVRLSHRVAHSDPIARSLDPVARLIGPVAWLQHSTPQHSIMLWHSTAQ